MNTLKTLSTAIAMSLAATGTLYAEPAETPAAGNPAETQNRAAKFLERFDSNKDGQITWDEIKALKQQNFSAYDSNQDGFLSSEELRQGMEDKRVEKMNSRFSALDTDQDGALTLQEWQAKSARNPDRQAMRFTQMDSNKDGKLTREELQTVMLNHKPKADAQWTPENAFARMDADHDNKLSLEEFSSNMPLFSKLDANNDQVLTTDELNAAGSLPGVRHQGGGKRH